MTKFVLFLGFCGTNLLEIFENDYLDDEKVHCSKDFYMSLRTKIDDMRIITALHFSVVRTVIRQQLESIRFVITEKSWNKFLSSRGSHHLKIREYWLCLRDIELDRDIEKSKNKFAHVRYLDRVRYFNIDPRYFDQLFTKLST